MGPPGPVTGFPPFTPFGDIALSRQISTFRSPDSLNRNFYKDFYLAFSDLRRDIYGFRKKSPVVAKCATKKRIWQQSAPLSLSRSLSLSIYIYIYTYKDLGS
jgi:hypothetical protein